jgi:hypothetical protein
MATQRRRIAEPKTPQSKREYQGQDSAAPLVNWLNITTDTKGRQRIINVVTLFLQTFQQSAQVKPDIFKGKSGYFYERETPESKKRDLLEKALEKALNYYRMVPYVDVLGQAQDLQIGWQAIPGTQIARNMKRAAHENWKALPKKNFNLPGAQMGESGALKMALRLFESGLISKIIPCRCGTFFFAKFRHQRFCSQKCRIAEFQSSDDARKKHNDYARMLYHRHKALDEGKAK